LGLWVFGYFVISAHAAPLDDHIAAYKTAPTQTEGAVSNILQAGLTESRSAQAFTAVKPWLDAQPSPSPAVLWQAGQTAERAGDLQSAVSFYRKLLKNPAVDAQVAAAATPAVYRLLLNHLGDIDAAYLFMREDGDRLRAFGRARQFDAWFITQAKTRADLPALCNRLAAIIGANAASVGPHTADLEWTCGQLESFTIVDEAWLEAARKLAAVANLPAPYKARINWAMEVVPFSKQATELFRAKQPLPDSLFEKPLQAAQALVTALPYEGSILAAKGWMNIREGDSGVIMNYLAPKREAKAAPILKALASLPPQQAQAVLAAPVSRLFSPADLRALALKLPAVFNSLVAPDVGLFDATLTVDEAKALSPLLARNPSGHAALVRAYAVAGTNTFSAVVPVIMKSEMWRFNSAQAAIDLAWNSGLKREAADQAQHAAFCKQYENLGASYDQVRKQVAKEASAQDRTAAFNTLLNDLMTASPTIPDALSLWNELFKNAPLAEALTLLKTQLGNLDGDREFLFRRAVAAVPQVGGHAIYVGPQWDGFMHNGGQNASYKAAIAPLVPELQRILTAQIPTGRISEYVFAIWLHAADPKDESALALMKSLVASPAYAKLNPAYHITAADAAHFGPLAMTPAMAAVNVGSVSRELLALPQDAAPAAVEAALKTVVGRAAAAPDVVPVTGLQSVAALPKWSDQTRQLVFSLFAENAPLGVVAGWGTGGELLVSRVLKELQEKNAWSAAEPIAAGLWHASIAHNQNIEALALFAEAAFAAGQPSVAMTVARGGLKSQISGRLRLVIGKAAAAIGAVDIPVDETDPAFPIYKSHAEFVQGNTDSAWNLYLAHADQLQPVLRKLTLEYAFWLLQRNVEADRGIQAEGLVKELTIWSREAPGTLNPEQEARLKIAYASLAFRKGALPTARAWFRKVADAAEYSGSEMQLEAALGSVNVDRVSKNFSSALTELDKLMRLRQPEFRLRVHYARAEVLMDQESYKEALGEIEAVLRQQPKHPDAMILRGKIQFQMRKLVEASEIELGPSQENASIVPGMALKINLRDPTLNVSGLGADIEVEVRAKSGDTERVLLSPLGDSKEKFRAELPTALGPPTPNDKTLQILGEDEIRFGYSKEFRAKMTNLPPDPNTVIGVASDASLDLTAGAFPPREGERKLDIEELGLSTAQAALGSRAVRPGNKIYLRLTDMDQSKTAAPDRVTVNLQTSSGDEIRRLELTETGPYTGEFQAVVPTAGAQALAFASESAPGRDPNMVISAKDYPGWQGVVGDKKKTRTFGIDLNDSVALGRMTLDTGGPGQALTHFVLQTSMNGKDWITRSRFPDDPAPWDGQPHVSSFFVNGNWAIGVSKPKGRELPADWLESMDYTSRASILSATVKSLSAEPLPIIPSPHFSSTVVLIRYRALFYQPAAAIRRFQLTGLPLAADENTLRSFLIDGKPAEMTSQDPFTIEREFAPGLHEIEVWCLEGRDAFLKHKPVLLCDVPGKPDLVPCPDAMFDPSTFPEAVRANIPKPAAIKKTADGSLEVTFGENTRARVVRLVILGYEGVAPSIRKVTINDREDKPLVPVAQDYLALRENQQLEVLPGDRITVRYQDPTAATPGRDRHEKQLSVAFNNGTVSASFLNYTNTPDGQRVLLLEPVRRFRFDDPVAIVINDADLDSSPEKDTADFTVTSSDGAKVTLKAVETEEHSGQFIGRVFPVAGEPSRPSEIRMTKGGTLTATYRDTENLDPGIPTDRTVTIGHAQYALPLLSAYNQTSKPLPPVEPKAAVKQTPVKTVGPEIILPRRTLEYTHVGAEGLSAAKLQAVIGSDIRFDVVVPHLALAGSSTINAYVQTEAARAAAGAAGKPFDVKTPGTLKLKGTLTGSTPTTHTTPTTPAGYQVTRPPVAPTQQPHLEEGRFSFAVPLILGDPPLRSFATKDAAELSGSALPAGLAVKAGDIVHLAYPWQDEQEKVHWVSTSFTVGSHAVLDVMSDGYADTLDRAYVGEKVHLRLLAPGLDRGPERDVAEIPLKGTTGTGTSFRVRETEAHSGIFKGVFSLSYADKEPPAVLPAVELNGFPVRYGDELTVSYEDQSFKVAVNKGADGIIEPFSKRFNDNEMAVRTSFTLSECYFELAKKHREMDQESLARREIGQARKLLAETLATHHDEELKAHAEYLLGNLSQEFADISKNEESKLPMYQDALARFVRIPLDYPKSDFASKSQFKVGLVYEKMGQADNAIEEYIKLSYKYPDNELIPATISRLGGYFQKKGLAFKKQADELRDKKDEKSQADVLRLDALSYPEFLNAAMVYSKLHERFPDDPLAGLAALGAAQNYMRAAQYDRAIASFQRVIDNEQYDGPEIRAQAMYWSGLSHERSQGGEMQTAYQLYRRVTFDFPDCIWAKYARGRLADPAFEKIIAGDQIARGRMIEALKEEQKNR
jgi:tetratricopeptide (TPR) repeat protein